MLKARLDKRTGLRVLCGRRRCDGELATISVTAVPHPVTRAPVRVVVMGDGWHQQPDGPYALSTHAQRRYERGDAPRDRRLDTRTDRSGLSDRQRFPSCLWSRHVDYKTPGDRASECRSLMEPIGVFARVNGEQAVVHQCRGCGTTRHCRVAADDPLLLMRLPLVAPSTTTSVAQDEKAGAA